MKKQRTILTYLNIWWRAACLCALTVGFLLAAQTAMAELIPITLKHEIEIESIAFSPDGTLLATGSWPAAKVWEMPSGRLLATLKHDGGVDAVAFSPDGMLLGN